MKHNWRFIKTEESKEHYVGCIIYQCNKCNMIYEFFTESPNSCSAVLNADVCGGYRDFPQTLDNLIVTLEPRTNDDLVGCLKLISYRLDKLEGV